MLNPGNDFRFSAFFSVAAIGSNHDMTIKLKKILFVNTPIKKMTILLPWVNYQVTFEALCALTKLGTLRHKSIILN